MWGRGVAVSSGVMRAVRNHAFPRLPSGIPSGWGSRQRGFWAKPPGLSWSALSQLAALGAQANAFPAIRPPPVTPTARGPQDFSPHPGLQSASHPSSEEKGPGLNQLGRSGGGCKAPQGPREGGGAGSSLGTQRVFKTPSASAATGPRKFLVLRVGICKPRSARGPAPSSDLGDTEWMLQKSCLLDSANPRVPGILLALPRPHPHLPRRTIAGGAQGRMHVGSSPAPGCPRKLPHPLPHLGV